MQRLLQWVFVFNSIPRLMFGKGTISHLIVVTLKNLFNFRS